jgi:deoxyribose-phosphate aldolase
MDNLNKKIDHTYLKPEATFEDIQRVCSEAMEHKFKNVCVSSYWVPYASKALKGSQVGLATTIGFPHGNSNMASKIIEIEDAVSDGATELDVVINMGAIKSKNWAKIELEIQEARTYADFNILKYIIEIGYLNDFEISKICEILIKHHVNYVKTCTGYGPRGVTADDIIKIKSFVGDRILIKASGGIKDLKTAEAVINAGADVIGTSNSINIIRELTNGEGS